ncbi:hypothetical protein [Caproicibacterium sp. BJN0003]|uniref:hypothetical protein n=1 Tax=Caproicibacterium sp. BJN0003 TaxID=2994078 RepID=UPI002252215D|nr:hypothetical protein [Caproicibacterium sp. BJN0003]UZT82115.1 hypothetical protein OP489_11715 [Caproicibacterium sp. BJN0003]
MDLLEYVGLIAIVSVAIYSVKKISVSCYRKKAMREWAREQRHVANLKSKNRVEMRVE